MAATSKKPTTRKKPAKKASGSSLLKSLPDSVENLEIVQQVASVLGELQNRVIDVKEEASKELHKIMKRYESHCKDLEKKLSKVTTDAKKQAQISMIGIMQKWHEHKEKLPKPMAKEIEKIIEQIGTKVIEKTSAVKKVAKKPRAQKTVAAKKTAATKKAKASKTTRTYTRRKAAVVTETPVVTVL